jgi:hypothetical protein
MQLPLFMPARELVGLHSGDYEEPFGESDGFQYAIAEVSYEFMESVQSRGVWTPVLLDFFEDAPYSESEHDDMTLRDGHHRVAVIATHAPDAEVPVRFATNFAEIQASWDEGNVNDGWERAHGIEDPAFFQGP